MDGEMFACCYMANSFHGNLMATSANQEKMQDLKFQAIVYFCT